MKYKAAILGLGRIAWQLERDGKREKPATHAGALSKLKSIEIVGGWDLDAQRRKEFSKSYRANCHFSSAKEMIQALTPDLVVVATWPDSHLELVKLSVESGVPLVICEKPLTMDLESARILSSLEGGGSSKTRILVNHERRYSKDYLWVKNKLNSGDLGKVLSFRAQLYLGKKREPWKTLLHDGTHMVDVLRFLSGEELKVVHANGDPKRIGETVIYSGRMNQIPLVFEVGSGRDHMVFQVEISLEKGMIRVGNGILEQWISKEARWAKGFRELKKNPLSKLGKTGYFLSMAKDALACLEDPQKKTP